jgi:hypothetical protein
MTQDEIIEMAKEAGLLRSGNGWTEPHRWGLAEIERFANLAIAHEREKSLRLWMLLDDVDTADDIAKSNDAVYRSLCRQAHAKRWDVLTGDEVDAAIRARGEQA